MYQYPLGVLVQSFRYKAKEGVEKAISLGVEGLQLYSAHGPYSCEELSNDQRKEIMDMVRSNNMCVTALCSDYGWGFGNQEKNPEVIEKTKRIFDMALEMGTNIVTTHPGYIPADTSCEKYKIMQEACAELAQYAKSLGAYFALETGQESAAVLKEFIESIGSEGLAVNFDPANLVMIVGEDPVAGVHLLKDYIVHTHAKDGKKLNKSVTAEEIGLDEMKHADVSFLEYLLGEGDVDFDAYLKSLEEIGYKGFLTIERESRVAPPDDLDKSVAFLKHKLEIL